MFQIHRLRFVFTMFCIGLSACASPQNPPLPQGDGQGVRETPSLVLTETFTLSPAPTETLAPTATPELTATPKPEVIVQQEITFDLTNGETLSMPGFFVNTPEGRESTEEEKNKTFRKRLCLHGE